jgi:hypothetical protein
VRSMLGGGGDTVRGGAAALADVEVAMRMWTAMTDKMSLL